MATTAFGSDLDIRWCPTCEEPTLAMPGNRCGFCLGQLLMGQYEGNMDLWVERIERMRKEFLRELAALAGNPECPMDQLERLDRLLAALES